MKLKLDAENDFGSIEYKLKLLDDSPEKINKLATQMRFRMDQDNNSKCIYKIGISDKGFIDGITPSDFKKTMEIIDKCLLINDYNKLKISEMELPNNKNDTENKYYYEFIIRPNMNTDIIDMNVCILGNVDSGKSTFLSCLLSNEKDDGRGSSRQKVFRHVHENQTGRTSSESTNILGIKSNGNITNHENARYSWTDIVKKSYKIISFHDLPGHEKYFKTTIKSMLSKPDYAIVLVNSLKGVKRMTFNHINLCQDLNIPYIILLTKTDLADDEMIKQSMKSIKQMLKLPNISKLCYIVKDTQELNIMCENFYTSNLVPIIKISNKTLDGHSMLHNLFNFIDKNNTTLSNDTSNSNIGYRIDSIFRIKGVGHVVGGILTSGSIKLNDSLWLGPFNRKYINVSVKSIHVKKTSVREISSHNNSTYVCLALKCSTDIIYRKGLVLLDNDTNLSSCSSFESIACLTGNHSTSVKVGYKPVICIASIRQAARIESIKDIETDQDIEILNSNQKAKIVFKFEIRPEYITPSTVFVCSEGLVKLTGTITSVLD